MDVQSKRNPHCNQIENLGYKSKGDAIFCFAIRLQSVSKNWLTNWFLCKMVFGKVPGASNLQIQVLVATPLAFLEWPKCIHFEGWNRTTEPSLWAKPNVHSLNFLDCGGECCWWSSTRRYEYIHAVAGESHEALIYVNGWGSAWRWKFKSQPIDNRQTLCTIDNFIWQFPTWHVVVEWKQTVKLWLKNFMWIHAWCCAPIIELQTVHFTWDPEWISDIAGQSHQPPLKQWTRNGYISL